MDFSTLAYIGPETAMPLLSAIATLIGVVLMAGKTTLKLIFQKFCDLFSFLRRTRSAEPVEHGQES